MAYIVERSVASLVNKERTLITIEFAPNVHPSETEYTYEHPKFVFGDHVTLVNEYPSVQYTVCGMELIESKTPSSRLLFQPRWKYKITDDEQTFWRDESALCRHSDQQSTQTCSTCSQFNDFQEPSGRGWCPKGLASRRNQFNHQAKTHHIKTNDCIQGGASTEPIDAFPNEEIVDPADLPHSEYQIGSLVKVIDSQEHHSEWAVFEVTECFYNRDRYRTTEAYMSETDWYYTISSIDGITHLEVSEIEICDSDISEHVCTEDIF